LDETLSTHGWLWGTPAFMAPEQVTTGGAISTRTDIYQLGATVHSLLAGTPPFTGEPAQVMYAVVHEAPPDLATLHPDVAPSVAAVVAQALAKDPRQRPSNPSMFAAELRDGVQPAVVAIASDEPTRRRGVVYTAPGTHSGVSVSPGSHGVEMSDAAVGAAVTERMVGPEHDRAAAQSGRHRRSTSWVALMLGGAIAALVLAGTAFVVVRGGGDRANGALSGASVPAGGVALQMSQTPTPATSPTPPTTPSVTPSPSTTPAPTHAPSAPPAATVSRTPSPVPSVPTTTPPPPAATPVAPTPAAPVAPATALPAAAAEGVAGLLQQTMARRGYTPTGPVEPVPLGDGGALYVQRGDGDDGQRLFVVVNDRLLGTDWVDASPMGVSNPRAIGSGQFIASYPDGDGGVVPVVFSWTGGRLRPDRIAPGHCQANTGC
jgi:hypothetical protein